MMAGAPIFRLRFPLEEIEMWASRYAYADDAEVEAIGAAAGRRGWYTRDEFLTVARWKTPRSQSRCARNTESEVVEATSVAFRTREERERIRALVALHGVQLPTASVLLHLARVNAYPIIDFRALWSLGIAHAPTAYSFLYWWAYTTTCRDLATKSGVSMRTLDRALWQYSKEHQPPGAQLRKLSGARGGPTVSPVSGGDGPVVPFPTAVHERLIKAAVEGKILVYSELPGSRRTWGRDLYRIADYEAAAGRPPLTAIVVQKQSGRPGPGFAIAMEQIGFKSLPGESGDRLWRRAVQVVFDYWRDARP
jgi:hypothetical protein